MAMRDKEGRTLANAHLLGFLWRILKLLFYGIQPIFVFDGGAPVQKRRTLANRKQQRTHATESHARAAEKLLAAQLRQAALAHIHGPAPQRDEGLAENTVYYDTHGRSNQPQVTGRMNDTPAAPEKKKRKDWHKDPYQLPALDEPLHTDPGRKQDIRLATESELRALMNKIAPDDLDTNSELFRSLPPELQYELVGDLRAQSRTTSYQRLQDMLAAAPTPIDFSRAQIAGLRTRNDLTQKVLTVTDEISSANIQVPVRVAGARNREYVLVHIDDGDGGWALGTRDAGTTHDKAIDVDLEDKRRAPLAHIADDDDELDALAMDDVEIPDAPPAPDPELDALVHLESNPAVRKERALELLGARAEHHRRQKRSEAGVDAREERMYGHMSAHAPSTLFREGLHDAEVEEVPAPGAPTEPSMAASPDTTTPSAAPPGLSEALRRKDASRPRKIVEELSDDDFEDVPVPERAPSEPDLLDDALDDVEIPTHAPPTRRDEDPRSQDAIEGPVSVPSAPAEVMTPVQPAPPTDQDKPITGAQEQEHAAPSQDGPPATQGYSNVERSEPTADKKDLSTLHSPTTQNEAKRQDTPESKPLKREPSEDIGTPLFLPAAEEEKDQKPAPDNPTLEPHDTPIAASTSGENSDAKAHLPAEKQKAVADSRPGSPRAQPSQEAHQVNPEAVTEPPLSIRTPAQPRKASALEPSAPETGALVPTPPEARRAHEVEARAEVPSPAASTIPAPAEAARAASPVTTTPLKATARATIPPATEAQPPAPEARPLAPEAQPSAPEARPPAPERAAPASPSSSRSATPFEWSPSASPEPPALGSDGFPLPNADEVAQLEEEEEDEAAQLEADQSEFASFLSTTSGRNIQDLQQEVEAEVDALRKERVRLRRSEEDITLQMAAEVQALLRLFGLPYITAPMEAEAQCAQLATQKLVDGIITDDSDVFLFGGTPVYRNMFNNRRMVECYLLSDIERELSLTRDRLIELAFLLGSDYTEGLPGVGPVLAMEILSLYPGESRLLDFRRWWQQVQVGAERDANDSRAKVRRRIKRALRDRVHLSDDWPDPATRQAYVEPTVDTSDEPFVWGSADLDALRAFLGEYLHWPVSKTDQYVLPVIEQQRKNDRLRRVQSTLDQSGFISGRLIGELRARPTPAYGSARLQQVVSEFRSQHASSAPKPSRKRRPTTPGADDAPARRRRTSRAADAGRAGSLFE